MKIALCLYGQPRSFEKGYETIKKYIIDKFTADVFFHTWETDTKYEVSPWRTDIDTKSVKTKSVVDLYQPKSFLIEKSMNFCHFLGSGYDKTPIHQRNNCKNIISQFYSRTAVRNILLNYCQVNNTTYDFVICCRFDICILQLPDLFESQKILFSDRHHKTRQLTFDDNLIICSYENYVKLFNFYPNLNRYVLSGPEVSEDIPSDFERDTILHGTVINAETFLTAGLIDNGLFGKAEKTNSVSHCHLSEFKKQIIITPSDYKIEGKNIFIITSCIFGKSIFTPQERYMQTFMSIESVRKYSSESTIVLVEMSFLPEEWAEKLAEKCEYLVLCGTNERMQLINNTYSASPGELALLAEVTRHLVNPEKIYKLSGRYYLKEGVPFNKFDYTKYNFLMGYCEDGNYEDKRYLHTTFFSLPAQDLNMLDDYYQKAYMHILSKHTHGVEQAFLHVIPNNRINLLPFLSCEGYISGRFGGSKILYTA